MEEHTRSILILTTGSPSPATITVKVEELSSIQNEITTCLTDGSNFKPYISFKNDVGQTVLLSYGFISNSTFIFEDDEPTSFSNIPRPRMG